MQERRQAQLEVAHNELAALKQQGAGLASPATDDEVQSTASGDGGSGSDGESKSKRPARQRQRLSPALHPAPCRRSDIIDSSCSSSSSSSDGRGSDDSLEAAPTAHGPRGHARGVQGEGTRFAAPGRCASWSEARVGAALEQLVRRQAALVAERARIDANAPGEDRAAADALAALGVQLDAMAAELDALTARRDALLAERYTRFSAALRAVNVRLSSIYRALTGRAGDAYLAWTEDRLAAFADGVAFHVRPDARRWRPFAALSGGQQARGRDGFGCLL